jgi:hypothetical protein
MAPTGVFPGGAIRVMARQFCAVRSLAIFVIRACPDGPQLRQTWTVFARRRGVDHAVNAIVWGSDWWQCRLRWLS